MDQFVHEENADLQAVAEQYKSDYQNADPFPSIHFDNFFNPAMLDKVLAEFPDLSSTKAKSYNNNRSIKLEGKGESSFGPETKKFAHFLNSQPFLEFLQTLTGIKEPLMGDPYFLGGGQHEIKRGGFLKIHADFNVHDFLGLDRRINALVYLNKDWKEEYGGHFELWDKGMKACVKKVLPAFNTLAIFSTTDFSYHGHPDPLNCPEDRSRRSLALYYYSNGRPEHERVSGRESHSTIFKVRANNAEDREALAGYDGYSVKKFIKDITPPLIYRAAKSIAGK